MYHGEGIGGAAAAAIAGSQTLALTSDGDSSSGSAGQRLPEWSLEEQAAYLASLGLVSLPGEEVLLKFLEDTLSGAPLPAPWITGRDEEKRLFFCNKVTGASSWEHPLEPVLRELAGVCRVAFTLPSSLRDATMSTMHSTWKAEAVREYERWYTASDSEGNQYYCHTDTGETMWESPADVVLPAYTVKLMAVERLRDDQYVLGLHQRAHHEAAAGFAAPSITITKASLTIEEEELRELEMEEQAKQAAAQKAQEEEERRAERREFESEVRQAVASVKSQVLKANTTMATTVKDEFTKVLRPLTRYVEDSECSMQRDVARARVSDDRVRTQLDTVQRQLYETLDILKKPPEKKPEHKDSWWWSFAPLKCSDNERCDRAYTAGVDAAKRMLKERGVKHADEIASRMRIDQAEEQLRQAFVDQCSMKEELMTMREAEMKRREEEVRLRLETRKRQLEMQWLVEKRENEWKAEMAQIAPHGERPLSQPGRGRAFRKPPEGLPPIAHGVTGSFSISRGSRPGSHKVKEIQPGSTMIRTQRHGRGRLPRSWSIGALPAVDGTQRRLGEKLPSEIAMSATQVLLGSLLSADPIAVTPRRHAGLSRHGTEGSQVLEGATRSLHTFDSAAGRSLSVAKLDAVAAT